MEKKFMFFRGLLFKLFLRQLSESFKSKEFVFSDESFLGENKSKKKRRRSEDFEEEELVSIFFSLEDLVLGFDEQKWRKVFFVFVFLYFLIFYLYFGISFFL